MFKTTIEVYCDNEQAMAKAINGAYNLLNEKEVMVLISLTEEQLELSE